MREKWTSVETSRDVYSVYTLCWAGVWFACVVVLSVAREDILEALDVLNYTATLVFAANYGLLAMVLGLLFAGLYLSAMRLTAIFWRMNKLKTNIFSNAIAILFCFLQMFLIKAVLGQYDIAIALPFVIANIVASFVTVPLLPKHGWFITKHSA